MATRRQRTKITWWDLSVTRAGFRGADIACKWAYKWGGAREALGHEPSVDEVAKFWRISRRTAFREQAGFREVFPEFETPAPFYESAESRASIRQLVGLGEKESKAVRPKEPSDAVILRFSQRPAAI